jgi:cyclic nucleotide gated channel
LSNRIIKAAGVVTKSAWGGAAYNLLLYMLASHVWSLTYRLRLHVKNSWSSLFEKKL